MIDRIDQLDDGPSFTSPSIIRHSRPLKSSSGIYRAAGIIGVGQHPSNRLRNLARFRLREPPHGLAAGLFVLEIDMADIPVGGVPDAESLGGSANPERQVDGNRRRIFACIVLARPFAPECRPPEFITMRQCCRSFDSGVCLSAPFADSQSLPAIFPPCEVREPRRAPACPRSEDVELALEGALFERLALGRGAVRLPLFAGDVLVGIDRAVGGGQEGEGLDAHVGGEFRRAARLAFEADRSVGVLAAFGSAGRERPGVGDLVGVERARADGRGDQGTDDALEVQGGGLLVEGCRRSRPSS